MTLKLTSYHFDENGKCIKYTCKYRAKWDYNNHLHIVTIDDGIYSNTLNITNLKVFIEHTIECFRIRNTHSYIDIKLA